MKRICQIDILGFALVFFVLLSSCARLEVEERSQAMRFKGLTTVRALGLDIPVQSMKMTIERLKSRPFGDYLYFGSCEVPVARYIDFMNSLIDNENQPLSLYEVYGKDKWGEVLLTSYFSPVYEGRKTAMGEFIQPVYSLPQDLVEVSFSGYSHKDLLDTDFSREFVSGRIVQGPGALKRIIPYYSRREIDTLNVLKGRKLELAYLRPVDAFVLQIQGSGKVFFPEGETIELGYAGQNGHRYFSIGKSLLDIIPKEEMSLAKIKDFLQTLSIPELYEFLAQNPSYIFFEKMKMKKGLTTFGLEPKAMRTIAIDSRLISLGSIGFLRYPHPLFKDQDVHFDERERIIFAHDTGGAIKGAGRADLFWGSGREAEIAAGVMRHPAHLYFFAPDSCALNLNRS